MRTCLSKKSGKLIVRETSSTTELEHNVDFFFSEIISTFLRNTKELEWFMYVPILNSKEKARELVDVVREQTDAPIGVCINTVSIILSALLRDLPDIYGLRVIKSALEKDYIIDVENCHDARVLEQVIVSLTSYIEDKGQLDWSIRNDKTLMVKSLQHFSGFMVI